MSLKTYQARSMAEALKQVKEDLGRDAVILGTRSVRSGGVLGIGARRMVEITAARGDDVAGAATREPPPRPAAAESIELHRLRDELAEVRQGLQDVVRETRAARFASVPRDLVDSYSLLIANQVADDLARELLHELTPLAKDGAAVRARLRERLAALVPTAGPLGAKQGEPYVVALVGPTGMGKTTTLAKLAANAQLREHRRVGLITIDNYRIGAVEQLRTYASIIDVPLITVGSPAEMTAAVQRLADRDLVLIDTAGRSPNDDPRLSDLKSLLDAAKPDEIHLVLSSTHSEPSALRAVEQFSRIGADRVLLTKLDEAVGFGVVVNVLRKVNLRLSYVTDGQTVPNDIATADATRIAELIVGPAAAVGE